MAIWPAGDHAQSDGKGQVIYVGVDLEQKAINKLVAWLCEESGIEQQYLRPDGMSIYERSNNQRHFLFVVNWSDHKSYFDPGQKWHDAFFRRISR